MLLKDETLNLLSCQIKRIEKYMSWMRDSEDEGFISENNEEWEETRYILQALRTAEKIIRGSGYEN